MKLQSSVAILAVLAISCGDEGPRPADVRIVASATVLHLPTVAPGSWGEIPYTLTNRGDKPAFYGACTPTPEQLVNGEWQAVPGPDLCMMLGIELAGDHSSQGQAVVPGPGTYRLRFTYSDDTGAARAETAISNVVTVQ